MTTDTEKHVRDIAGLPTWAELPEELREKTARLLLEIGDLRKVESGDTWIREGEHSDNKGYILLKGTVAILRGEEPTAECDAPALLGEMMQFNPRELRLATVTALTRCTVLRFEWNEFWNAAQEQFDEVESATLRKLVEQFAWSRFMDWD